MKRIILLGLVLIFALAGTLAGCAPAQDEDATLYQVSTLQALIVGAYDGEVTARQMLEYGDTGLGTFDALDGEMIVLDGKVYKARTDGSVSVVPDGETIPFANVAHINSEQTTPISWSGGYDGLKAALDEAFPPQNMPVLFCMEGTFESIEYRSVPEQDKPYPPLTDVVKEQAVFNADSIRGTLVGFRFPGYLDDMNAVGYHLHFISEDRSKGGHLLEAASGELAARAQTLDAYYVVFPDNLRGIDMTADEDDVSAVEKK